MGDIDIAKIISGYLLQINAIKLSPANPFTWASGIKSPIYCDNRKILSYPDIRNFICNAFVKNLQLHFSSTEIIAGVATGAIAHGMLVANALHLPFIYVRSTPKGHGLENMIEGELIPGKKVTVIEDLISTGQSSINAVNALKNAGAQINGMLAIFTYELPAASQNFAKNNLTLYTLANYSVLIETALEKGYIQKNHLEILKQWKTNPENWLKP